MIVSLILAAIVVVALFVTEALPALFEVRATRRLSAAHVQLNRGNSALSRFGPVAWLARILDTPLLITLGLVVLAGAVLFTGLLDEVAEGASIVDLDARLFYFLQEQRTEVLDRLLIAMTGLGDQKVVMPVALAGLLVLAGFRRWRAAAYLLIATAGAAVFVGLIKKLIHRARPISIYDGVVQYSFPSGHACMSIVLYGFLAFLLAYGAPRAWQRAITFGALVLIGFIAFSRVYLGAHWLSDVLAGLAFGAAWVCLLIAFYVHGRPAAVPMKAVGCVVISVLFAAGTVHVMRDFGREKGRYTAHAARLPTGFPVPLLPASPKP